MNHINIRAACIALAPMLLAGCVALPSPVNNLREASLDTVERYGASVSAYLANGGTEEGAIAKAQEAASYSLKDPDSAKFRNVRIVGYFNWKLICGEINAKNSYGAYVGYSRFVAGISAATIESKGSRYPEIDAAANAGLDVVCRRR